MATATTRARADFDAVDLLLADSRLARVAVNEVRSRALRHVFAISRGQANLLTLALVLAHGGAVARAAGRVVRWPAHQRVLMSGLRAREGAIAMAGTAAGAVSPFATLMTIAPAGGVAIPVTRRAVRTLKATEPRLRMLRERQYANARRTMEGMRPWDRSSSSRSSPLSTRR